VNLLKAAPAAAGDIGWAIGFMLRRQRLSLTARQL
jgi:hypothetical protein